MVKIALFLIVMIPFAVQAAPLGDPLRPAHYLAPQVAKDQVGKKKLVAEPNFQLNAILFSTSRSVAVIDGKSLQVGDRISDYQLVIIEREQVILKKKQKQLVLRRPGSGLKTGAVQPVAVEKGIRGDFVKTD